MTTPCPVNYQLIWLKAVIDNLGKHKDEESYLKAVYNQIDEKIPIYSDKMFLMAHISRKIWGV